MQKAVDEDILMEMFVLLVLKRVHFSQFVWMKKYGSETVNMWAINTFTVNYMVFAQIFQILHVICLITFF